MHHNLIVEKVDQKNVGHLFNFQKLPFACKQSPNGRKFGQSGVDVMITIFCDFCQFSAKKLAFSQKPML
jgi:hypothetical protein